MKASARLGCFFMAATFLAWACGSKSADCPDGGKKNLRGECVAYDAADLAGLTQGEDDVGNASTDPSGGGTEDSGGDTDVQQIPLGGDGRLFNFLVTDAEFSAALNALVMVTETGNRLILLEPDTGILSEVVLSRPPISVSVGPDGTKAAVGHDALITYVDLNDMTILKELQVSQLVEELVLAGNGWIYAMPPNRLSWDDIRCVEIETGYESLSSGNSINGGTQARLNPGNHAAIYGADRGISPSDIERYDISGGVARYVDDSPYHGDYPICGDLWFSEDGRIIYTACGNTFRASDVPDTDMTYAGALPTVNNIDFATQSAEVEQVAVIPAEPDDWYDEPENLSDSEIRLYNSTNLKFVKLIELTKYKYVHRKHARYVFYSADGSKLYVVFEIDPDAGLLYNFGYVIY